MPGGQRAAAGHIQHPCGPRGAGPGRPPRPPEQVRTRDSNRTASPGAGAGQRYLWYCACRNWNSSLIRSQDSEMVNLKGCAGWCGACKQATRSFRRPSVAPRPRPRALRHGHGGLGSAGVRPAGPGRAARGSNSGRRRRTTIRKWLQLGGPCCTHRVPGLRVHLAQVADHPRRFGGRWRPRSGLSAQRWGAATGRGAPVPPSRGWRGTPGGSGSEARRRRPRGPGAAATSPGGGRRRAALPEHRRFERSGGRGGAQRGGEGEGGGQGEPLGRERCAEGPRSQFSASRKLLGPAAGQRRRAGRSGAALPRGRGAGAAPAATASRGSARVGRSKTKFKKKKKKRRKN